MHNTLIIGCNTSILSFKKLARMGGIYGLALYLEVMLTQLAKWWWCGVRYTNGQRSRQSGILSHDTSLTCLG